ncbi:hypothetical protein JTE90_019453 [Oedothorax gibbosus]|uniref:Secreted protein n=1 Tax=Oedothorax gibbosus TaxID=931172 RepID=A0AAV6UVF3_9ARAC|nr:hypothetical protein JTE90_019453 [Oedothorax gibbosus]
MFRLSCTPRVFSSWPICFVHPVPRSVLVVPLKGCHFTLSRRGIYPPVDAASVCSDDAVGALFVIAKFISIG